MNKTNVQFDDNIGIKNTTIKNIIKYLNGNTSYFIIKKVFKQDTINSIIDINIKNIVNIFNFFFLFI